MRILFFQRYLDPSEGGVERVSWILSKYFREKGHECFHAYLFDNHFSEIPEERKLSYVLDGGKEEQDRWIDFIREKNIDIVMIQDIMCENLISLPSRLKSEGLSTKTVGVLHLNPEYEQYKKYPFKTRVKQHAIWTLLGYYKPQKDRAMLARAVDKYVLLSSSYIPGTKKMFGIIDRRKLVAIGNPLSFQIPEYYDWGMKKNQCLMVARMDDMQKDFKSALRIWKCFEEQCPDYELLIAGAGKDEEMVRDYARELDVKSVRFLGHIDDPVDLYKESKFYLMTSRYEGWGMVLTEAMEYGMIPFVKDTYGAASDIIDDGQNGFLISPEDEGMYTEVLVKTANNPELQRTISKNAYDSCERFSSETIGEQWLELFRGLIN